MNKKDWQDGLKRLQEIRKTAQNNFNSSKNALEETDFMIEAYESKIKTFK